MEIGKRYQYKNECVPSTMLSSAMDRAGKDGWELKYLQIDEDKSLARMVYMREEVTGIYGEDYYLRKDMAMYMQQMQDMERSMKEHYDAWSKMMEEMMNSR